MTHPSLWDAVRQEEESYAFVAEASSQPQWNVPETIAINVAVADRAGSGTKSNLELFTRARTIAAELGRRPATADQYRIRIGLPARG